MLCHTTDEASNIYVTGMTRLCSNVEQVKGRKMKNVVNHLDHICNMFE
jgi:hypothetical protein